MNTIGLRTRLASVILLASTAPVLSQARGSDAAAGPAPVAPGAAPPPWQLVLRGDDAERVKGLDNAIDELERQGRFAEAMTPAREVLAIRRRAQGEGHWETISARIEGRARERIAGQPRADQSELAAVLRQQDETESLRRQGRHAEAEPLLRRMLAVRRRILGEDHPQTAESRDQLAVSLDGQGKYDETDALLRDVLAIRLRTLGDDHPQSAESYVKLAANLDNRGKSVEAEPLHQKAMAIARRTLGEDHLDMAVFDNHLARHLDGQGKYVEAERLYRRALAIRLRAVGEEHPDTGESYNNLADNLSLQRRHAEAEPLFDRAWAIVRKAFGEDHPHSAATCNNLAMSLNDQGKYAEAEPLFRRALAIRRRTLGEDHPETAQGYNNLAYNLDDQGRYAEAEPLLHRALAIRLRILGEDHPLTARSYNNLAFNLNGQGRHAEAEPLYRRALAIRLRTLGEGHPLTARSYNNLASDLQDQDKDAEAEPLLKKALEIYRGTLGEDHPDTALTCNNLAYAMVGQGRNGEAEPLFRKALAIHRSALGEEHPETASTYIKLASTLDDQGGHSEADTMLRKALGICRRALGEDHPTSTWCYTRLAINRLARGDLTGAEETAMAAVRSHEAARARVSFAGLSRAEFATKYSPSALAAALLARRGQDRDAWRHWESSLARGLIDDLAARNGQHHTPDERRRRDELIGQLNRVDNQIGALAGAKGPTDVQRKRLDELKARRLALEGELVQMEAELVRKYQAATGVVYTLERIQAQLPADTALVGWVDLKTLPRAFDPGGDHWACVVRRRGAPRWVRIVGTGPGGAWTAADEQRPGRVRQLLRGGDRPAWQEAAGVLAAQRLDPLEPALADRDGLTAVRHLVILPSPELAGIPVEPMVDARMASAPRYLVSYAPSGTLFSRLRERRREGSDDPARPRRLLALGDPVPPPSVEPAPGPPGGGVLVQQVVPGSNADEAGIRPGDVLLRYDGATLATRDDLERRVQVGEPRAAGFVVSVWREGRTLDRTLRPGPPGVMLSDRPAAEALLARREADAVLRSTRGAAFARLPGSAREVRGIAELFDRSVIRLGSDASEQTLDSLRVRDELETFAVIHLATHGEINDLSPMSSRLLLSQDNLTDPTATASLDGPAYDGILTAGEVLSTWKVNAELVTLSACRSGMWRSSGGEGHVGFAQAFFLAGARSLIVSLWEVDDRATSLLMARFYQNWLGKRAGLDRPSSKAEALREAKAWLRQLSGSEVERELEAVARGELRSRTSRPAADHPFAHPHDWAGFILMGDPD
jgi:tetratricopeptide (TPR) repeat protein